ncbi:MAG: energy-coupling factor ABC transporter permease [Gallionella sp.]|nr:energy-coupling factor ABC transporter permease [Gallionella sp.]
MNLPAQLFADNWLVLANTVFALLLYRAVRVAPWRRLLGNANMMNALIGLLFCTPVFWHLNAGIHPGFNFHLIGATLFLLMFGWPIALVMLSLVMLGTWLYSGLDLIALGLNGLLMLALPMLFGEGLLRFCRRYLPKNFFIFVLLNGFACAALACMLMMFATTLVLLALSHYTWPQIQYHYLIPAPILIFAEAFATGAVISAFTVSQPEAVMNFSIDDYLTGK